MMSGLVDSFVSRSAVAERARVRARGEVARLHHRWYKAHLGRGPGFAQPTQFVYMEDDAGADTPPVRESGVHDDARLAQPNPGTPDNSKPIPNGSPERPRHR